MSSPSETKHADKPSAGHGLELKKKSRKPALIGGAALVVAAAVGAVIGVNAAGSGSTAAFGTDLKVGYLSTDAAQEAVLEYVAEDIAPDYGIHVIPTGIGDPNQISQAANDGELAATIYAHKPWIEQTNAAKGWKITPAEPVFQWSYSLYSSRYGSLKDLPDGARIGILDDPANTAQALMLLQGAGAITLDSAVEASKATLKDIKENPRGLKLQPIAFGTAARSLGDLDAIISYNFEFVAAGTPAKYRIYAPEAPQVFASQLAIGTGYLDDPNIEKLIEAFKDPKLQDYLATTDDPAVKDQLAPVSRP
ncbi:MetQ/NlpA family ABC transporter substrate-binding protein [Arthrobacter sp. GCM10027362]|uniref:MetQ/NlpA family ABC transporter substrate-binding protein n=1 Tax=Arthrobacter sp. GCM10027362 TaxID=3273379 RepID=UPI00363FB22D